MPNITTKAAFARICGVSKPAIAKAIVAGKVKLENKKVNLDHRLTQEYYAGKTGKKLNPAKHAKKPKVIKPAAPAKKKKKAAAKPTPAKKKTQAKKKPPVEKITAKEEPDDTPEPDNGYALPPGIEKFEDITIHNLHLIPVDLIKKIKEFEVAAKAKQAREASRGDLIERKIVKQIFSKIHTVDTNQWKTLDDKIVPVLCGLFDAQDGGVEAIKARKMISEEVTKILRYTKRLIDEFFIDNEGVGA